MDPGPSSSFLHLQHLASIWLESRSTPPCLPVRHAVRFGFTQLHPQGLLGVTKSARRLIRARVWLDGVEILQESVLAAGETKEVHRQNCWIKMFVSERQPSFDMGESRPAPPTRSSASPSRALVFPPLHCVQPTTFFLELSLRLEVVSLKASLVHGADVTGSQLYNYTKLDFIYFISGN